MWISFVIKNQQHWWMGTYPIFYIWIYNAIALRTLLFFFVSAYSIPFEMTLAMFNSRLLHLLPLLATALAAPQNVPQALANLDRQMKDAGKLYFGAGVDRSIIEESETADILNEVFGAVTPMNKQVHTFLNAVLFC